MTVTRKVPRRRLHVHTIHGRREADSLADVGSTIADIAYDAIRAGQGNVQVWLENDAGKADRPLGRYYDFLRADSIPDGEGLTRPQREQNTALRRLVARCEDLRGELASAPREAAVIDAGTAAVLRHEIKQLAGALVGLLEDADHVKRDIAALPDEYLVARDRGP